MALDYLAAEQEAQAHATPLARLKRLEKPVREIRRDALPAVLNLDLHRTAAVMYPDPHAPFAAGTFGRGIDCVAKQIHQDLPHLNAIRGDPGNVLCFDGNGHRSQMRFIRERSNDITR
jgi:hypothetical protein